MSPASSPRRDDLLELAYQHVLTHGLADMSLRPLASAIGSSPRVLLFLFGSKDGLVRALLERARADELALLEQLRARTGTADGTTLGAVTAEIWHWLAMAEHRALLTLWAEAYTRSLTDPEGAWNGFARGTVRDWLDLLTAAQDPAEGDRSTLALAVLRGALLDLLATGETERITGAVLRFATSLGYPGRLNS